MKIWGNKLNIGDNIYYIMDYEIRQGKIVNIDTTTFRMKSMITHLGDRIFVNQYYYTEKQEVIDELLEHLKTKCKLDIIIQQQKLKESELKIKYINDKLKKLNNFDK